MTATLVRFVSIMMATIVATSAAHAQSGAARSPGAITAKDPQSISSALQKAGYKAELTKDDTGDPLINSSSGGSNFAIFFFGCNKNVDCATIQFFAGYSDRKPTLQMMNDWNSKKRFGRAYISTSGSARIEMDVDLDDGGMSSALFEDNLEFWVAIMGQFERHIAGDTK